MYLGKTSLMYAAMGGHTDIVLLLLKHGEYVNIKTFHGKILATGCGGPIVTNF